MQTAPNVYLFIYLQHYSIITNTLCAGGSQLGVLQEPIQKYWINSWLLYPQCKIQYFDVLFMFTWFLLTFFTYANF